MNKIKEAIAKLRVYLGHDEEGIRRLEVVAAMVNDMRKSLAKATEDAQHSRVLLDAAVASETAVRHQSQQMKDELANAVKANDQAERKLLATRQHNERLEAEMRRLTADDTPELPEGSDWSKRESPLFQEPRLLADLIKTLRSQMRVAPGLMGKQGTSGIYELTEIMPSYRADDIMRLGRFVAAMALMNYSTMVVASENIMTSPRYQALRRKEEDQAKVTGKDIGPSSIRHFIRWFRSNIASGDVRERGRTLQNTHRYDQETQNEILGYRRYE